MLSFSSLTHFTVSREALENLRFSLKNERKKKIWKKKIFFFFFCCFSMLLDSSVSFQLFLLCFFFGLLILTCFFFLKKLICSYEYDSFSLSDSVKFVRVSPSEFPV